MELYTYSKEKSLVNFSSSILKYFGVKPFHSTIPELDEILEQSNKKKVVVFLFDALAKYNKNEILSPNDILRKKVAFDITSVFPPTTVACTTAFLSAKYPNETGWLGWSQHFNDLNVTVDMFTNKISKTDRKYERPISYERCSYKSIIDLINEKGDGEASKLTSKEVEGGEASDINHFFQIVNTRLKSDKKQFMYCYWTEPDHSMHLHGVHSHKVRSIIKDINKKVANIAKHNKDTLFLVIADHGQIDIVWDDMNEHPDFVEMLKCKPYIDSRSPMFLVKDEYKEVFPEIFNKYYGENYLLFTKEEVIEKQLFGLGDNHPSFDNFWGDYLATSISTHAFFVPNENGEDVMFIGHHAGSLKEEFEISVAVINRY